MKPDSKDNFSSCSCLDASVSAEDNPSPPLVVVAAARTAEAESEPLVAEEDIKQEGAEEPQATGFAISKHNASAAKDTPSSMSGLDSADQEDDIDNCNDLTSMPEPEETEDVAIQEQDLEAQVHVTTAQLAATNVNCFTPL